VSSDGYEINAKLLSLTMRKRMTRMTLRGDRNLADGHEATTEMNREEQMGVGWKKLRR
jgi:hypothetical protein